MTMAHKITLNDIQLDELENNEAQILTLGPSKTRVKCPSRLIPEVGSDGKDTGYFILVIDKDEPEKGYAVLFDMIVVKQVAGYTQTLKDNANFQRMMNIGAQITNRGLHLNAKVVTTPQGYVYVEPTQYTLSSVIPDLSNITIYVPISSHQDDYRHWAVFTSLEGWNDVTGDTDVIKKEKVLHHMIWNLGRFSADFISILEACLTSVIKRVPFTRAMKELHFLNGANEDSGVSSMYKAMITLGLVAKSYTGEGAYIKSWASTRFNTLLATIKRKDLETEVPGVTTFSYAFGQFIEGQELLTRSLVHYVIDSDPTTCDPPTRALLDQVFMLYSYSGLQLAKMCYDFCLTNKSEVWTLTVLVTEGTRLKKAWEDFEAKHGKELAPFGRLLGLQGVSELDHSKFENLAFTTNIYQEHTRDKGKYNLQTRFNNVSVTDRQIRELLTKTMETASIVTSLNPEEQKFLKEVIKPADKYLKKQETVDEKIAGMQESFAQSVAAMTAQLNAIMAGGAIQAQGVPQGGGGVSYGGLRKRPRTQPLAPGSTPTRAAPIPPPQGPAPSQPSTSGGNP